MKKKEEVFFTCIFNCYGHVLMTKFKEFSLIKFGEKLSNHQLEIVPQIITLSIAFSKHYYSPFKQIQLLRCVKT